MSDIILFIRQFLADSWRFFQINIPGTNVSFAMLLVGIGLFNVGFSVLSLLLGVHLPEIGGFIDSRRRYNNARGNRRQYGNPSHTTTLVVSPERANDER